MRGGDRHGRGSEKTPAIMVDSSSHVASLQPRSGAHLTSTTSGFPFSTIYVASSAALPLPTFF
ncbi:MAG TPA: hypothetical protein VK573_08985, partial [Gemmatimonadales bacterium]|nr:hypothetical protein [Gemmatimonadales bacterium]